MKTAWDKMKTKTDLIHQMFQKTGFLIRKDGIDKHLIKVDGILMYICLFKSYLTVFKTQTQLHNVFVLNKSTSRSNSERGIPRSY